MQMPQAGSAHWNPAVIYDIDIVHILMLPAMSAADYFQDKQMHTIRYQAYNIGHMHMYIIWHVVCSQSPTLAVFMHKIEAC